MRIPLWLAGLFEKKITPDTFEPVISYYTSKLSKVGQSIDFIWVERGVSWKINVNMISMIKLPKVEQKHKMNLNYFYL